MAAIQVMVAVAVTVRLQHCALVLIAATVAFTIPILIAVTFSITLIGMVTVIICYYDHDYGYSCSRQHGYQFA